MRKRVFLIAAATLLLLGGAAANELAPPWIASVPVPGDDPLTLRFQVSNRGYVLGIRNLDFICVPDRVEGRATNGAPSTAPGDAFPMTVDLDLGPGASFQYTCPIFGHGKGTPATVTRIRAHVEAAYTRFGRRAHTRSANFTWDSQSKVWVAANQ
jgi:hypothetical protein